MSRPVRGRSRPGQAPPKSINFNLRKTGRWSLDACKEACLGGSDSAGGGVLFLYEEELFCNIEKHLKDVLEPVLHHLGKIESQLEFR
ncbi:hypothetical protein NDU88_007897 [Pleurodeles waltl]|uniref:Uncharacterized protein n=1 Tax=Pleurodeles waltl TaxID=8319 RepID=A0AAV7U225_PLEWA|nr:hypothetical protein NDU88_007897 [Pleurodeles waltl]